MTRSSKQEFSIPKAPHTTIPQPRVVNHEGKQENVHELHPHHPQSQLHLTPPRHPRDQLVLLVSHQGEAQRAT